MKANKIKETHMLLATLIYCFLLISCTRSEETKVPESTIQILIFKCEISVPSQYQLVAYEMKQHRLSKSDGEPGTIAIENYDESLFKDGRINIQEQESFGGLKILTAKISLGGEHSSIAILIHDEDKVMSLLGNAIDLKDSIVSSCLETRKENGR